MTGNLILALNRFHLSPIYYLRFCHGSHDYHNHFSNTPLKFRSSPVSKSAWLIHISKHATNMQTPNKMFGKKYFEFSGTNESRCFTDVYLTGETSTRCSDLLKIQPTALSLLRTPFGFIFYMTCLRETKDLIFFLSTCRRSLKKIKTVSRNNYKMESQ